MLRSNTGLQSVRDGRRSRLAICSIVAVCLITLLLVRTTRSLRHVIIIDCGSSGTRIYAYTWQNRRSQLPRITAIKPSAAADKIPRKVGKGLYNRVETQPGLDKYSQDASGLESEALGPLLDWARAVVPAGQHSATPIFLLATAGIRKLPEGEQQALMAAVQNVLIGSGFRFDPSWAHIIRGSDEGLYGWVAMNYQLGTLGRPGQGQAQQGLPEHVLPNGSQQQQQAQQAKGGDSGLEYQLRSEAYDGTVGALDLGGSSLEVTLASDKSSATGLTESKSSAAGLSHTELLSVELPGLSYSLQTITLRRYGLNDAFDRSVMLLLHRQQQLAAREQNGTIAINPAARPSSQQQAAEAAAPAPLSRKPEASATQGYWAPYPYQGAAGPAGSGSEATAGSSATGSSSRPELSYDRSSSSAAGIGSSSPVGIGGSSSRISGPIHSSVLSSLSGRSSGSSSSSGAGSWLGRTAPGLGQLPPSMARQMDTALLSDLQKLAIRGKPGMLKVMELSGSSVSRQQQQAAVPGHGSSSSSRRSAMEEHAVEPAAAQGSASSRSSLTGEGETQQGSHQASTAGVASTPGVKGQFQLSRNMASSITKAMPFPSNAASSSVPGRRRQHGTYSRKDLRGGDDDSSSAHGTAAGSGALVSHRVLLAAPSKAAAVLTDRVISNDGIRHAAVDGSIVTGHGSSRSSDSKGGGSNLQEDRGGLHSLGAASTAGSSNVNDGTRSRSSLGKDSSSSSSSTSSSRYDSVDGNGASGSTHVGSGLTGSSSTGSSSGSHGQAAPGTSGTMPGALQQPGPTTSPTGLHAHDASDSMLRLEHPCMHLGYVAPYQRLQDYGVSPTQMTVLLHGAPDWAACSRLAAELVQGVDPACGVPPCEVDMPQLEPGHRFMGLSGFYVVWKFFGVDPTSPMQEVMDNSQKFCSMGWHEVQAILGENINVERYCLWGPYMVQMLQQGLRLKQEQLAIGGGDFSWTLGAALVEASKLPSMVSTGGSWWRQQVAQSPPKAIQDQAGTGVGPGKEASSFVGFQAWLQLWHKPRAWEVVGWMVLVAVASALAACALTVLVRALLRRRMREQLATWLWASGADANGRARLKPMLRPRSLRNISVLRSE